MRLVTYITREFQLLWWLINCKTKHASRNVAYLVYLKTILGTGVGSIGGVLSADV